MHRIVVQLRPGLAPPAEGDTFAGGVVIFAVPESPYIIVEVPAHAVMTLDANPDVADHRAELTDYGIPTPQPSDLHVLDAVQVGDTYPLVGATEEIRARGHYGAGDVLLCVGDTGFDAQHVAFAGKRIHWLDVGGSPTPVDTHGHGTWCTGTAGSAWGIASDAEMAHVRVLTGPGGSGSESDIARGLKLLADFAVARGVRAWVCSLSLGGSHSDVMNAAVAYGQARGGVFVCAAGNDGPGAPVGSPADAPGAIVVGATDRNGVIASFSTGAGSDPKVTVYAPGVQDAGAQAGTHDGVAVMSGTSMATPQVAGCVQVLLASGLTATEAVAYIRAHQVATNPPASNGHGIEHLGADFGAAPAPVDPPADPPVDPGTPPDASVLQHAQWVLDNLSEADKYLTDAQAASTVKAARTSMTKVAEWHLNVRIEADTVRDLLSGSAPPPPPDPPVDPPTPPPAVDEDWANLIGGAVGLCGQTKWLAGSTGLDLFVREGTVFNAPHAGTVTFQMVPGGPMPIGELHLVYDDGRAVRLRHVKNLVANGARVAQGQPIAIATDPSMRLLHWPASYPTPPDGYEHFDISLATSEAGLNPTGGAGGNVGSYHHIFEECGGIPNVQVIARTPGPPEGMQGFAVDSAEYQAWATYCGAEAMAAAAGEPEPEAAPETPEPEAPAA